MERAYQKVCLLFFVIVQKIPIYNNIMYSGMSFGNSASLQYVVLSAVSDADLVCFSIEDGFGRRAM